ncbi:hypothetical protein Vafri_15417 [Volvox africanus]|uniref:Haloacid dehalogenase-like hydrolase n=1 Tax=Volvox africanus TaxID=51714 RepID=A0A8J4F5S0_9CHLO|nr:hypothetical protein Vafri_15417 [Volvox africanus]
MAAAVGRCCRFQEILAEVGFNGGRPIDEVFFRRHISGRHNPEIAADLFPEWDEDRRTAFYLDKEERYRRLAAAGLEPLQGLREFLEWVRQRGLRTAAVTNAPRANAEMMLAALGVESCFEHLVLGEECMRAKPHPDPYLIAMDLLGLTPGRYGKVCQNTWRTEYDMCGLPPSWYRRVGCV